MVTKGGPRAPHKDPLAGARLPFGSPKERKFAKKAWLAQRRRAAAAMVSRPGASENRAPKSRFSCFEKSSEVVLRIFPMSENHDFPATAKPGGSRWFSVASVPEKRLTLVRERPTEHGGGWPGAAKNH